MKILAIETSCDETSAAVVKDGSEVLSNVISSQVDFHRKYGGIVPELASRKHIEVINAVIQETLEKADVSFKDLDAVAVTYGPGLVGSLLVGICSAKAIAWSLNVPLIGINHLEGHIYANFLSSPLSPPPADSFPSPSKMERGGTNEVSDGVRFPFLCLLVSGGHTMLVLVEDHGKYKTLGRTRDDAAGEAFDKIARFLDLGYPGGPIIDKLAKEGNPDAIPFKRPMIEKEFGYDFSFSGLKTAVVNYTHNAQPSTIRQTLPNNPIRIPDIAASFQQAIVDVLVEKTIRAAKEFGCSTVALAGGVSANSQLRAALKTNGEAEGLKVIIPPFEYCTDNAAMIGCAGYFILQTPNLKLQNGLKLTPLANLRL